MEVHEYAELDGVGLAALVKRGEVSAGEVYTVATEAIRSVDERINAVADGPWERPLEYSSGGPFAGVPTVIKDLVCHAKGVPTRLASRLAGDGIAFDYDTFAMRRMREAGLAAAALTTAPEFGCCGNTVSVRHGITRNPWDLGRSAGGSSGGTGALVAAGGVPIGHANDGGGSIRVPAAFNGLVGLKPSRGRTSLGPYPEDLFGFVIEFALSRTVRDCAALLDALSGRMPGDSYAIREPSRPWAEEVDADPGALKVALQTSAWNDRPTDGEVVDAVERVGRQLEDLGHAVEPKTFELDWQEFVGAMVAPTVFEVGYGINAVGQAVGVEPSPETLEHTNLAIYADWRKVTATDLFESKETLKRMAVQVDELLGEWDLLITPAANTPAPPVDYIDPNDASFDSTSWVHAIFECCSFTPLFNATGHPAISLPLGWTSDGLPIGVQVVGRMADEATLFRLAGQLERAMPWAQRRPDVYAGAVSAASAR